MAATLTADQELTYFSIPIEKVDETPDGDLIIWGKATDGALDGDLQVVDPEWSAKALREWFNTGGNVRFQHDPKRPIGKGLQVEITPDGHYVKSLICEEAAKGLIRKGIMRDYSVGISHPKIDHDPMGKAVNGIIRGHDDGRTKISELSVVDRGSNPNARFQLVKAAADGTPEWVGRMVGTGGVITKDAAPVPQAKRPKTVNVDLPANMSLSIKPSDLAKLANLKRGLEAQRERPVLSVPEALKAAGREPRPEEEALLAKVAVSATVDGEALFGEVQKAVLRDSERAGMPASDFAYVDSHGGKHLPVQDEGHVRSALGRFVQQEFESPAARKKAARKIVSRARGMGLDLAEHGTVVAAAGGKAKVAKAAEPQVTKCGTCGGKGMADGKPCPDCKKGRKAAKRDKAVTKGLTALNGLNDAKTERDALKALRDVEAAVAPITKKKGKLRAVCPGCGAKQNPAHKHCPECGRELPSSALMTTKNHDHICLGCGKELDKGEKYCPDCGRENPGYLPEADRKIPANQDKTATAAGKERVLTKGKKAKGKKTPASAGGAVSAPEDTATTPPASEGVKEVPEGAAKTASEPATAKAGKKAKGKKGGKGKKVPPWMKDSDGDGDDDSAQKSAAPGDDPELLASLRLRQAGVPAHMGIAHDLTCPAFLPAEVDACYPGVSLKSLDLGAWQEDVLEKAAGASLEDAQGAVGLMDAAMTLRAADPLDLQDIRDGAHKMFRDANPGPGSFPTPTQLGPAQFHRPYITEGHAAASPGHDAPNHAAIPPVGGIHPDAYRRGYLSEGHADDSPGNTHPAPPAPAPDHTGVPTTSTARVFYRNSMREGDEHAMRVLHDHISGRFPAICPMHPHFADKPVPVPTGVPPVSAIPGTAGLGSKKEAAPGTSKADRKAARAAKAAKTAKRKASRAAKAAKAKRDRVARRVLKGTLSVEEAQVKLGMTAHLPDGVKTVEGAPEPPVVTPLTEADLRAATKAATAPLVKRLKAQDKALRGLRKTADAIAGQPDTTGAPFRGVALPKSSGSPAGTPAVAKSAEQYAADRYAILYNEWQTTQDPTTQAALARALAPYWNPAMTDPQMSPPT